MRPPGVSLKCMCQGIYKVCTDKREDVSVHKRTSIILVMSLFCLSVYKEEGVGQKFELV